MTTVFLVRHAEAEGNILEVFQGRTDCNVTEKGYLQLKALAERFKDIPIEAVYSSPLIRTMETAKAVNFYHKFEIIKVDGIMEIDGGVFEGKHWKELPALFPEAYDLWANKHHAFEVQDGEKMIDVYDRMKKSITQIVSDNKGKTIAIVSHGCAIRNFLCYANKFPFEELDSVEWCDNTGVCKFEFDDDELFPNIVFQNDSSHLDHESSTLSHQSWWKK